MKKYKIVLSVLIFICTSTDLIAQNLLKDATLDVVHYSIRKVRGNEESHVYPDVNQLKIELGEDVFGDKYTKFSFTNAAGDQSFLTWYKDESVSGTVLVQRYRIFSGTEDAPVLAVFTEKRMEEENVEFDIAIVIPDAQNGIVHEFLIQTKESYFNHSYLVSKLDEKEAFALLRKSLQEVILSDDITEFKGVHAPNWVTDNLYKTTIDSLVINGKVYNYDYAMNDAEFSDPASVTISLIIDNLDSWLGKDRGSDLRENDILKIESMLEELTKGRFIKLYLDDKGKLGDYELKGITARQDFYDDIFFVSESDKDNVLEGLITTHISVDVEYEYGRNTCTIEFVQY